MIAAAPAWAEEAEPATDESPSRLTDEVIPFKSEDELPAFSPPIIEIGDPFLATGNLHPGFTLPTGAVWQPRFWVFGTLRSAVQTFDTGVGGDVGEWMNRLDLFGNLQLTGTERLVVGVQPLHTDGAFTGQVFETDGNEGFRNNLNARVRTLFFEGDLGELFPQADVADRRALDYGFSVGRQQIFFQDGLLINDTIDAFGLTRNSVRFAGVPWISNLRITGLVAWDEIHRDDNVEDADASLYGLFTALDTPLSTIEADAIFVAAGEDPGNGRGGDLFTGGVGAIQRFDLLGTTYNSSLRVLGSAELDRETAQADSGVLVFGEVSWTPHHTFDLAYVNAFLGIDNFSSAARDPLAGGPLGRTGILFAAQGVGAYPAPLGNRADDSYGASLGYQFIRDGGRRQLIIEIGGRDDDSATGFDAAGIAARFQQAVGRRAIVQLDAFATAQEHREPGYGARTELLVKF